MPAGAHLVVALLVYPLLWGPAFVTMHTQERRLTEYGLGLNVKVFVGAAVTTIFLLVWPWSNNSVAKSVLEAYARTSEELLFRGFLLGELRRLFKNSRRKNMWAAIVSSVIFAGMHTHHGLRLVILRTLPNSAWLGLIAVWTDSILLPIVIHCGTAGGKQSALLGSGIWLALCLWARASDARHGRRDAW